MEMYEDGYRLTAISYRLPVPGIWKERILFVFSKYLAIYHVVLTIEIIEL